MAKETMIELEIPQGRMEFPVEQADGILRMKFNGGWKLPEDSEWSWSPEKGFEKKAPKAAKGSKDGANGSNGANGQSEE
jgi:hypothetical protein